MKVLLWFLKNYPEIVAKMKESNHSISNDNVSIYHAEGDIWTHTMMVYSHIKHYSKGDEADVELELAVLLHDIGKPDCKKISSDEDRFSFTGHENLSTFLAIDILNKYKKEKDSSINIPKILHAINYHSVLHRMVKQDENGDFFIPEEKKRKVNEMFDTGLGFHLDVYELLFNLSKVDSAGRISIDEKETMEKYSILENYIPYKGVNASHSSDAPEAHFMIGLPGSGKSTKIDELLIKNPNLIVLSVDDEVMRLAKYSDSYDSSYTAKRNKEASQNMLLKMKELILENKSFIFDATNFSEDIRQRRLSAVSGRYKKIGHLQIAGFEFIKNVMKNRKDKSVPLDKILSMAQVFKYPSYVEFDEILIKEIK